MTVKEIVLVVKDRPGELARIIGRLFENDVQVPAFWIGTDNKKATIRMITSDPEKLMFLASFTRPDTLTSKSISPASSCLLSAGRKGLT